MDSSGKVPAHVPAYSFVSFALIYAPFISLIRLLCNQLIHLISFATLVPPIGQIRRGAPKRHARSEMQRHVHHQHQPHIGQLSLDLMHYIHFFQCLVSCN